MCKGISSPMILVKRFHYILNEISNPHHCSGLASARRRPRRLSLANQHSTNKKAKTSKVHNVDGTTHLISRWYLCPRSAVCLFYFSHRPRHGVLTGDREFFIALKKTDGNEFTCIGITSGDMCVPNRYREIQACDYYMERERSIIVSS